MGKFGITTSRKKWINEEVEIKVNSEVFSVGVVEYTDDWSPFKSFPFDKVVGEWDSKISEGEDEDDGVSETWMQEDDNEIEEGEFRLDATPKMQPEKSRSHEKTVKSPVNLGNIIAASIESMKGVSQRKEPVNDNRND